MENSELVSLIKQHLPSVTLIYLFGSRATNEARPSSDWDIAVMAEKKIPVSTLWELKELLANTCRAEVDLIDLLQSTTVLNVQIIERGQLLYDAFDAAMSFETRVLSMYGRLQEGREDIMTDFVAQLKGMKHG
jgi:predicted nucleotidyltransferase